MSRSAEKRKAAQEHNVSHERALKRKQAEPLFRWFQMLSGHREMARRKRMARHNRAMLAVTLAAGLGAMHQ